MSQVKKLYDVLQDKKPHRSDELLREVYDWSNGPCVARLSARIFDCRQKFGLTIKSWRDPQKKNLTWYQIKPNYWEMAFGNEEDSLLHHLKKTGRIEYKQKEFVM